MNIASTQPRASRVRTITMVLLAAVLSWTAAGLPDQAQAQPRRATVPAQSVYVSADEGDDRRDGRSAESPVQTIERALRMARANTTIYLERGGTYGSLELPSIMNLHVQAYGEGDRPIIRGDKAVAAGIRNRYIDITLEDLHLIGEGEKSDGVVWRGETDGLTFRNVVIENYRTAMVVEGGRDRTIKNVAIENSVIKNNAASSGHSHGVFANWVHGMAVRNTLFDRNGSRGDDTGTVFNHALYVQVYCTGLHFENNVSSRSFADGGQFRTGGIVRHNVSVFNPIGFDIGGVRGGKSPVSDGIDLIFDNNIMALPGDIDPENPRGIGLLAGNLRKLEMRGNHFLFARGGTNARNTAIRIVDVSDVRLEQLDARDNRIQDFPTAIDDRTKQNIDLQLTEVDTYTADEAKIHAWLDQAANHWGEDDYNAAGLRALLLEEK